MYTHAMSNLVEGRLTQIETEIQRTVKEIEINRKQNEEWETLFSYKQRLELEMKQLKNFLEDNESDDSIGKLFTVKVGNSIKKFLIVYPNMVNPSRGHISINSPIAQALINGQPGDTVPVNTHIGTTNYTIIDQAKSF